MIMAENKIREKNLIGKAAEPKPAAAGIQPGGKGRFFRELRGLFTKSSGKEKQPAGVITPVAGRKPALARVLEALSLQRLDLKTVNRALMAVLAGLVVLTFYVIFRDRPDVASLKAAVQKINFGDAAPEQAAPFQDEVYYVEQAKKRDIFNIFVEKKEPVAVVEEAPPPSPPPPPEPPKVPIEDKAKGLKLIGISWGASPKAMIKNEKTQEVLFVAQGDVVQDTEVTVQEITKDEVILASGEDTMSLK